MEHKDTFSRYAIIQIGTNQYQAIEGKTIQVQLEEGQAGDILTYDEVLLRKTGDDAIEIGQPFVGSVVRASIVKHMRGPKIIIYHFKRRKKSRVKNGHRQQFTIIRIESI